jgi:cell division protease FtsH
MGPPGTGKTLLARAVAGEAGVPLFSISGSEFVEMFVGVGASRVGSLFKEVKEVAPAILFLDELDAVGRRRGAGIGMVNDDREQPLNQLLVERDGFDASQGVIVVAATNRPDVLDRALRRPGRFDREVVVGLPDLRGRRGILAIHSRRLTLAADVSLDHLAAMTMGMSGAQLANPCNEAVLLGARAGHEAVRQGDFERALDTLVLGEERCLALGVTEQRPEAERHNLSRRYLLARLSVMLAGRAAEEMVIGDLTTGAENDLREATLLARRMVAAWGMSELGLAAYEQSGDDRFLGYDLGRGRAHGEETARRIDEAVQGLLEERHRNALELLEGAQERLTRLAESLLARETLERAELERLLGPRAMPRADRAAA